MRAIKAILIRNLTNFTRDRMRLVLTLAMSFFFLFMFSFVMKSAIGGIVQPMSYLISGMIIMTVFQTALNNSMGIIDDIASGFMKEILVAPISRLQISIGQILASMVIAVLQGFIIIAAGFFLGLKLDLVHATEMVVIMLLVGVTFSSIGLFLATLARNSSTFQIMTMIIIMPLTFLSGALIPTTVMPGFLLPVVYINPLTYTTAVFRYVTLQLEGTGTDMLVKAGIAFNIHGFIVMPYMDLLIILIMGMVFTWLCVNRFNGADFSAVKVFVGRHR